CCVCFEDECDDTNPFVYCDGPDCEVIVHRECYGLSKCPGKSDDWFCDRCEAVKENPKTIVACALCPDIRGAFRKLEHPLFGVEWTHIACAVWVPEVDIGNAQTISKITLDNVPLSAWKGRCGVCEEPMYAQYGASVKCSATSCDERFHVTC
ncbi:PHD-zinc-finger like domain-containing protein, partial [Phycomyces blakesleeanus]